LSSTVANVPVGGLPFRNISNLKETVTDVTVTTNSEIVTAANLGLNAVFQASAVVKTGQATDTGTYVTATIDAGGVNVTLAEFTADGTAATTAASTVIRVRALGY
jgi:hypothetical protein